MSTTEQKVSAPVQPLAASRAPQLRFKQRATLGLRVFFENWGFRITPRGLRIRRLGSRCESLGNSGLVAPSCVADTRRVVGQEDVALLTWASSRRRRF